VKKERHLRMIPSQARQISTSDLNTIRFVNFCKKIIALLSTRELSSIQVECLS